MTAALNEAGVDLETVSQKGGRPVLTTVLGDSVRRDARAGGAGLGRVRSADGPGPHHPNMLSGNPRGYFLMVEWDIHTDRVRRGLDRLVDPGPRDRAHRAPGRPRHPAAVHSRSLLRSAAAGRHVRPRPARRTGGCRSRVTQGAAAHHDAADGQRPHRGRGAGGGAGTGRRSRAGLHGEHRSVPRDDVGLRLGGIQAILCPLNLRHRERLECGGPHCRVISAVSPMRFQPIDSWPGRWHRRRRGRERNDDVDVDAVPAALAARLGPEATGGLLHVLDLVQSEWSDNVISARRRTVRASSRGGGVESARADRAHRGRVAAGDRSAGNQARSCRGRPAAGPVADGGSDPARSRHQPLELLKWSFLFWIGQVVTMSAIIAAMLRVTR